MRYENGLFSPEVPQLLYPVADVSSFLPPSSRGPYKESLVFENDNLYIHNFYTEADVVHKVYDKNTNFPNYALYYDDLRDRTRAETWEYTTTYDRDLMDKPLISVTETSIYTSAKDILHPEQITPGKKLIIKSDLSFDAPQTSISMLEIWVHSGIYEQTEFDYDKSCDKTIEDIRTQLARIPRQNHKFDSEHLYEPA